jgi:hypothetical protein
MRTEEEKEIEKATKNLGNAQPLPTTREKERRAKYPCPEKPRKTPETPKTPKKPGNHRKPGKEVKDPYLVKPETPKNPPQKKWNPPEIRKRG